MGDQKFGIAPDVVGARLADENQARPRNLGVQIGVVIGGGNIFRGWRRARGAWIARPATTWACSPPSSTRSRCRTRSRSVGRADARADGHRDARRSPSRSSAAAPCATWRRAASSSSPPAPAIRISRPTPPPRCAPSRCSADVILKATKVDGIYNADPKRPDARRTTASPSWTRSSSGSMSWTPRRSRSASTTRCRSRLQPATVRGNIQRVVTGGGRRLAGRRSGESSMGDDDSELKGCSRASSGWRDGR